MNVLAEQFDTLNTDVPGLWHVMLPRGTSYCTYLPMLCMCREKNRQIRHTRAGIRDGGRGKVLSVLSDSEKVSYVGNREDMYVDELIVFTTAQLLRILWNDEKFARLCRECPFWFVDCHDLLDGTQSDDMARALIARFLPDDPSKDGLPYVLLIHSCSNLSVEREYGQLRGRGIVSLVPPPKKWWSRTCKALQNA